MIAFLILCLVSIFAGLALLTLLDLPVRPMERWLLAPAACLTAWVILLGIAVSLGISVRQLALPFWAATAILCVYGVWQARGALTREAGWPLLMAMALPIALMGFDFWRGLGNFIGGPAPDGWSYVARGQQLWEMSKDTQGHLAPLYQYATHLHLTRFIASALLAVFSPLTGGSGDTQEAAGYFVAWSLFVFGASCASAAVANRLDTSWVVVLCAVAVASRWVLGAVQIHNYDNLIAISFLPMTVGLVSGLQTVDWRTATALGAFLAAAVYTYPEMAAFVGLGTALSLARRASADPRPWPWVVSTSAAVVVAALLLLPAWRDLAWFISNQLTAATALPGTRAGEGSFAELLSLRNWGAAAWGLESHAASLRLGMGWELGRQVLGTTLWLLASVGCVRLVRQRLGDIAAIGLLMILGALFMSVHERYSYGAYKFLLLGWWSIAWFVVSGAQGLIDASRGRLASAGSSRAGALTAMAVTLPLLALLGAVAGRVVVFEESVPATSVQPYRSVLDVERVIGHEPLILAVDDDLANEWAVYFLRGHPIQLLGYRAYMAMPHVVPVMQQAAQVDLQSVKYVLSDEPLPFAPDIVWRQGPYTLWRIPSSGAAFLRSVTNPNGSEKLNGRSFYWIGGGDTELDVFATSGGEAVFSGRFIRGPSLPPDRAERRLLIGGAAGTEKAVTIAEDGNQSFSVPVNAGENRIHIRPLAPPDVRITGGNDAQPILLGVQGLSVSLRPIPVH
jgi:hypothetical protein